MRFFSVFFFFCYSFLSTIKDRAFKHGVHVDNERLYRGIENRIHGFYFPHSLSTFFLFLFFYGNLCYSFSF